MAVNKHTQQSLIGSCGNVQYRNYTILLNSDISQHQTRSSQIFEHNWLIYCKNILIDSTMLLHRTICSKNENVCEAQVGFTPVSYCKSNT